MIAKAQVIIALSPWIGLELTARCDEAAATITSWLNMWSARQELQMLADKIDSLLFRFVRDETQGKFLIRLPDDTWVRIRLEDFSAMADDVLGVLMDSFPVDAPHFALLQGYSMQRASLSALRVLYTRFASMESAQELSAIAQVAKNCYPAFRWREWLN